MKTLKQLWIENGEKPFWAKQSNSGILFYIIGMSPISNAVGWVENGNSFSFANDSKEFTFCDDPTKPKPKMRVLWFIGDKNILPQGTLSLCYQDEHDPKKWEDITDELRALLKGDDE